MATKRTLDLILVFLVLMLIYKASGIPTDHCRPAKHQHFTSCGDKMCQCSQTAAICGYLGKPFDYIPKLSSRITHLYFKLISITYLSKRTFTNVSASSIKALSFFGKGVINVSRDAFFGLDKLTILCFDLNSVINKTQISNSLGSLRTAGPLELYLEFINLTDLFENFFSELNMSNLVKIDLTGNHIKVLKLAAFRNLENLTELILAKNWIREISLDTGLLSLSYLNLGENEIGPEIPRFCSPQGAPLFPSLTRLTLMQNFIREIPYGSFKCLTNINSLNLERNGVAVLMGNVFSQLTYIRHLNLNNMKEGIKYIHWFAFNISSLETLTLVGNDIVIDAFKAYRMFNGCSNVIDIDLSFNDFHQLLGDELLTLLGPLKGLQKLSAVAAGISVLPTTFLDHFVNLTYINFGSNRIIKLPFLSSPTRKIKFVSLQANNIHDIDRNTGSIYFLRSVKKVSLADNPFSCTCENLWFRSIINRNGKINNTSLVDWPMKYHCATPNKLETMLLQEYHPTDSSCNINNYFIIVTVPLVVVLVCGLLTTFIVYRYRWYVKYWLYKLRSKKQSPENYPLLSVSYDAFVIYNISDCDYVHRDFRFLLEEAHAYKLHLWERDVTSGHDNFREMVAAVEASQNAIAIISKDSLDDGWFQFQLSVAVDRQVELKRPYLMLVILENVDCERLSKFWCVLLTRLPTARWCPDETDVKRTVFEQQLCRHLRNRSGH